MGRDDLSVMAQDPHLVFPYPAALCSPVSVSDDSLASLPGLLASVPSCVEDLSSPVAEPTSSQTGSTGSAGG